MGASVLGHDLLGLRIYGIVGIAFGGLMAATGATMLGWGLIQRKKHREWMRERGLTRRPLLAGSTRRIARLSFLVPARRCT
jgi:hypothetical protein